MTQLISSRVLSPQIAMSPDLTSAQRQSNIIKVNKDTKESVAQPKVQLLAGGVQIVHATNGRIRIRATDGSSNTKLETIAEHLRQQQGVKEAFTNQQTASLVVSFDENLVTLPQMLKILQQFDIQQYNSPQSLSNTDPFAAWKSLDFWKEQSISFIPLMAGLAVTGGLGISGLAAIPVYMITSDATRRAIDYLEPQFSTSEGSRNSHTVAVKQSSQSDILINDPQVEPPLSNDRGGNTVEPTKVAYKVVHAIPGRIRFHIPQLAQDRAYARRLERLIKTDPQVINVRLNSDAASIAIAYHPGNVTLTHWVSLMESALETNPPTKSLPTIDKQLSLEPISQPDEAIALEPVSQPDEAIALESVNQPDEATDATTSQENTTLDVSSLWADMKLSGLSFSLAFLANFPL